MSYLKPLSGSADYQRLLTIDIAVFAAAVLIMLIAILLMTNSIIKPVKKLIGFSESLAAGNTDFKIDIVHKNDEIGQLARAIRNAQISLRKVTMILNTASGDIIMATCRCGRTQAVSPGDFGRIMDNNNKIDDSICGIIRSIRDAASSIAAAAQEISSGSQDVAQGSTTQSANIDEISNTVTFYLDRTKVHSENALNAKRLSDKVNSEALNGSRVMAQLMRLWRISTNPRHTYPRSSRLLRIYPSRQIF
jgi:methyl-accepting chemotaxis protein